VSNNLQHKYNGAKTNNTGVFTTIKGVVYDT